MTTMRGLHLIFLLLIGTMLFGQNIQHHDRSAAAVRVQPQSIKIDGKLDDPGWQKATAYDSFTQRDPRDGKEPSYPTSFRIAYDAEYLYVGVYAVDPEPDKIKAILTRRDDYTESDWVYVSLDSYNDNRTAFEFGLNAAGVRHDLRRYDDNSADFDWDAVWDGAVQIQNAGWSAEFRIPFRELRFNSSQNMEWGLQVYREFPRNNNELDVWNYWSKDDPGFVSQYGTLTGLSNIESTRPLYISPYVVGQSDISDKIRTMDHPNSYDLSSNIGADVRYTFSSGLTMNATVNPDFGQVEADPADFNLTAFETYFAEKRPFFKEGGNIMTFSMGFGDGDAQNNSLYYSRRIGEKPAKILAAGKLTGKTENGLSVGVMDATTADNFSVLGSNSNLKSQQPLTNYFLSRLQKDYRDGQTTIGGILTAANRSLNAQTKDYLHSAAYTGGLDFENEFHDGTYTVQGAVAWSDVQGSPEAITRTQMSPARYFQRPDAAYLSVDSSATSLAGYATKLILGKISGHWQGAVGILNYSPGFEVNDLGYLQQVDNVQQFTWISYRDWEPTRFFQEYQINFNQWATWNYAPQLKNVGGNVNMHATLHNNWDVGMGINRNLPGLNTTELRGGPAIAAPSNWSHWGYVDTDSRKDVYSETSWSLFISTDNVYQYQLSSGLVFRPRQNIQFLVEPGYTQLIDTWSWLGKAHDQNDKTHYLFSGLDQKTLSLTLRADYTIMPNLSIQYYAQPYITAGNYHDPIETADVKAQDFDERFKSLANYEVTQNETSDQYEYDVTGDGNPDYFSQRAPRNNFNFKQFRSNLVIRWEYSSGSVMYLVWSQGYTDIEQQGQFQLGRDFNTLFSAPSDNVLLLKVSYLVNV